MNNRDKTVFLKMLGYCKRIAYAHRYFHEDKALFFAEEEGDIYRDAVAMDILQIGELANTLSDETLQRYSDIPWRDIVGMRNICAHHYGSIERDTVWDTSTRDVPALAERVQQILEEDAQD